MIKVLRKKIDFIVPPVSGHLFPMLYLATQLKEQNPDKYDIRFISGLGKKEVIEAAGFPVHILMPEDPYIFDRLSDVEVGIPMIHQMNEVSKYTSIFTEQIQSALTTRKTELAVVDFITYPGVFAVESLKLPWITCIPTPFAIENIDGTPAFLGGLYPSTSPIGKLRDWGGRMLIQTVKQLLIFKNRKLLKPYLPPLYNEIKQERIYSSYSILAMGLPSFQFPRTWPEQLKFVGYGVLNEEQNLDIPFSEFKYSILVTTGTMMPKENKQLREILMLVASQFPDFLFVLSGGNAKITDSFQHKNILEVGFVPYDTYLPKFDYVVHHGGAGIVNICIKYAKPSIVIPKYNDQPDFAARIDYFDIGIWLKKTNDSEFVKALKQLIACKSWPMLTQFQKEAQQLDTGPLVASEVDRLLALIGDETK